MTPEETVLEAVAHRETDIIPYVLHIHPEIQEKLHAHYGGRAHFPEWERRSRSGSSQRDLPLAVGSGEPY